jgi:hypothetical protein
MALINEKVTPAVSPWNAQTHFSTLLSVTSGPVQLQSTCAQDIGLMQHVGHLSHENL